jgi:small subunit ribosomal protein S20
MPQHKSCEKRLRQADKARTRNRFYRATLRTEIKKVRELSSKEEATTQLQRVFSVLDKLAKKGIIHKNNVANQKSKLSKLVSSLA